MTLKIIKLELKQPLKQTKAKPDQVKVMLGSLIITDR